MHAVDGLRLADWLSCYFTSLLCHTLKTAKKKKVPKYLYIIVCSFVFFFITNYRRDWAFLMPVRLKIYTLFLQSFFLFQFYNQWSPIRLNTIIWNRAETVHYWAQTRGNTLTVWQEWRNISILINTFFCTIIHDFGNKNVIVVYSCCFFLSSVKTKRLLCIRCIIKAWPYYGFMF